MSYRGLEGARSEDVPHLGGNIKAGDPFTYAPSVWDYVISRFCIASVLDLGSGCGNASHYFHAKGLKVVAIEGFRNNVENSLYPAVMHDLTESPVYTQVDLVHCQEVVEHIEEKFLDNLIGSLVTGKYVLMTHATPGQGGYHHVNCQTSQYWKEHLTKAGCVWLEEDTARVKKLAEKDGALFLSRTALLFANSNRI